MTGLLAEPIRNTATSSVVSIANRLVAGLAGQIVSTSMVLTEQADDDWFLSEEWQAGERAVDAHVARGEVVVFNDVEDFLASLDEIASAE
jgi:hypothetical protein